MFASLRDCVPLIKWSRHLESPQDLLTTFDQEVEGYLKDKVLDPLCRAVEEDLRLSSHLHLQLDDRNPYKVCRVCIQFSLSKQAMKEDTLLEMQYMFH